MKKEVQVSQSQVLLQIDHPTCRRSLQRMWRMRMQGVHPRGIKYRTISLALSIKRKIQMASQIL